MMPKRRRSRRIVGPSRKPGPLPKPPGPLQEGRDYYCGRCVGRKVVDCDYCVDGCPECKRVGQVACPACQGGTVPPFRPDFL